MAARKRSVKRAGPKCKRVTTSTGKTIRRCWGPNGKLVAAPKKKRARR